MLIAFLALRWSAGKAAAAPEAERTHRAPGAGELETVRSWPTVWLLGAAGTLRQRLLSS